MMKIHVKQTIVINRPTEDVFAYISNLENLLDWSSFIISLRTILPGVVGVGATTKNTIRFLGKRSEMTLEVVEWEPSHSLTIKSTSGVTPCLFYYQFEQLENGGTSIAQDAVISFIEGFRGLTEQVVLNAIHRDLEHGLLTLKDMLETSTSTYCSAVRV